MSYTHVSWRFSMRKLKVEVTAHDIKSGARKSCELCPIARALKRALNYKKKVDVNNYSANIDDYKKIARLPTKASAFIRNFDNGFKVKPFSMTLEFKDA